MFWDSVDELFFPGMLDEMFNVYMDLLKRLAKRKELFEEKSASLIQVKISEARKLANETLQKFPTQTLNDMFLKQADKEPYREAVVSAERRMTYREVKLEALYIARLFKRRWC